MEPKLIYDKLTEMGYPEQNLMMMVNKLSNLTPEIMSPFLDWLTGVEVNPSIEGISFEELTSQHKLNPIASFLTLDWLVREPDKALPVIRKGYDRVEVNNE